MTNIGCEINSLLKQKETYGSIAKKYGVHINTVLYYAKKLHIHRKRGRPRTKDLRKFICDIINRENPQIPLTDTEISVSLKEKGFDVCQMCIYKIRRSLNIPAAWRTRGKDTRQKHYFLRGLTKWKENGKHKIIGEIDIHKLGGLANGNQIPKTQKGEIQI